MALRTPPPPLRVGPDPVRRASSSRPLSSGEKIGLGLGGVAILGGVAAIALRKPSSTPPAGGGVPPVPTGLRVASTTSTGATILWDTPPSGVTTTVVVDGKTAKTGVSGGSYQITGQTPGSAHTVQASWQNAAGSSALTASVGYTCDVNGSGNPPAAPVPRVRNIQATSAAIVFPPVSGATAPYVLTLSDGRTFHIPLTQVGTAGNVEQRVTQLTGKTKYTASVVASNAAGNSPAGTVQFTTL